MRRSAQITGIAIAILCMTAGIIWYAVVQESRAGVLTVSFLDVGQGDAVFITSPSGNTVLIDGGQTSRVLRELGTVIPWYDRSIDVIIPTHADADHIGGLIDVLDRYQVSHIIRPSTEGTTALWRTFTEKIKVATTQGTHVTIAQRGQIINLGGSTGSPQAPHAYLEVLMPDRPAPDLDTNTGCIVTRLVYGDTAFLLPCDAPQAIEKYLVMLDGTDLRSDVLKAGHHGSKTSSGPLFLGYVNPHFGVYSRGCDNTYGMPHKETIATFEAFDIPTLDTCEQGTITFESDGQKVTVK
ncbi:MBL fold metallo-hydrolase [Candidatus Kaiserbacteria bacterium]|nr:MBL fold metallo-hydrolase [Candidatus Kaiserbacteria bacterium]